eukprot:3850944-Rhodomonas_salina.2
MSSAFQDAGVRNLSFANISKACAALLGARECSTVSAPLESKNRRSPTESCGLPPATVHPWTAPKPAHGNTGKRMSIHFTRKAESTIE